MTRSIFDTNDEDEFGFNGDNDQNDSGTSNRRNKRKNRGNGDDKVTRRRKKGMNPYRKPKNINWSDIED